MNKTINISLPKKLADLAQKQVDAGYYASVSEVIRDALRNTLTTTKIPVIPLSPKAEKQFDQALQEYQAGKAIEFTTFEELID